MTQNLFKKRRYWIVDNSEQSFCLLFIQNKRKILFFFLNLQYKKLNYILYYIRITSLSIFVTFLFEYIPIFYNESR